jgi:hypothetical protein
MFALKIDPKRPPMLYEGQTVLRLSLYVVS